MSRLLATLVATTTLLLNRLTASAEVAWRRETAEGAGAHADADARWPAGRDPAQGLTQVHAGGYGDVHNIADAGGLGRREGGGQVGREAVRVVVLGDDGAAHILIVQGRRR